MQTLKYITCAWPLQFSQETREGLFWDIFQASVPPVGSTASYLTIVQLFFLSSKVISIYH